MPIYTNGKMPEDTMAMVNENGDWIGIIRRQVMTKENAIKLYPDKAKTINEILTQKIR